MLASCNNCDWRLWVVDAFSLYVDKLVLALNPSFPFRILGLGIGIFPKLGKIPMPNPPPFSNICPRYARWGGYTIDRCIIVYVVYIIIYKQQTIIASHNFISHYYCMLGMIVVAEKFLHAAVHLIVGTSCTVTSPLSPLIFFLIASLLYFVINCTVPLFRHSTLMVQVSKGSYTQKEREKERERETYWSTTTRLNILYCKYN